MKSVPFRPIGGQVIAYHGPIPLAQARDLAGFYALEADHCAAAGALIAARTCSARAARLHEAVRETETWRRAAGWTNPDAADP